MATYQEVIQALRNADAAGDTETATRLAQIAASMSQTQRPSFAQQVGKQFRLEPFSQELAEGMFVDPALAVGQLVSEATGLGKQSVREAVASREQRSAEAPGGALTRLAGNILSPATALLAQQVPQAVSQIPKIGGYRATQAAATGAVGAPLISPAVGEDVFAEQAQKAGIGAALGPVVDIAAAPLARLGTPSARPELGVLQRQGIDVGRLTPGQQLGGTFKTTEEALKSIPVAGEFVKQAEIGAFQEFNRGLIQRVIDQVNPQLKIPAKLQTRQALNTAYKELGKSYKESLSKMRITPTKDLYDDLSLTVNSYADELVNPEDLKKLSSLVEKNVTKWIPEGKILLGTTAKRIDEKLGTLISNYAKGGPEDRVISNALTDIQVILRDKIAQQDPSGKIKATNAAYADFLRLQDAAARSTRADQIFTPEQLLSAVKSLDSSKRKGAFARGQARMQETAEAGRGVLGTTVPESGTSPRMLTQSAATGLAALGLGTAGVPSSAIAPAIMAGGGVAAMYSKPGLATIRTLGQLGPGLRSAAPIVAPSLLDF
jgi:hypothetical protein